MKEVSREELAYIAGFFDGEGHVGFTRSGQNKTYALRVCVTNTNLEVLEWIRAKCGGKIQDFQSRAHWKVGHHLIFLWDDAVAFLESIYPWLKIKQEQAIIAFAWDMIRHRRSERKRWVDNTEEIELLTEQLKWLNKKGANGQKGVDPMTSVLQEAWGVLIPSEYIERNFEFVEEEDHAYHE